MTPVVERPGEVIVPAPETIVRTPVPSAGEFPFSVALDAHKV